LFLPGLLCLYLVGLPTSLWLRDSVVMCRPAQMSRGGSHVIMKVECLNRKARQKRMGNYTRRYLKIPFGWRDAHECGQTHQTKTVSGCSVNQIRAMEGLLVFLDVRLTGTLTEYLFLALTRTRHKIHKVRVSRLTAPQII
jgi:hypothetical protein